jgi:methionyl-tRNA formyltransferase
MQPSDTQLSTIILLNQADNAARIAPFFQQQKPNLNVLVAETLDDLRNIPPAVLKTARLVSVCGTTIVPGAFLRSLGFSAYNFHPGPPIYPGWAPFNFAIYDGATSYGTTVHQMVDRVDAGPIIGVDFFQVAADASVRDLMKLITGSLKRQIEGFAGPLVNHTGVFPSLPIPWAPHNTTKKHVAARCAIPPDIEADELRRRIRAFGDGDGYSVPTLIKDGLSFVLAPEQDGADDENASTSVVLHGIRFVPSRVGKA